MSARNQMDFNIEITKKRKNWHRITPEKAEEIRTDIIKWWSHKFDWKPDIIELMVRYATCEPIEINIDTNTSIKFRFELEEVIDTFIVQSKYMYYDLAFEIQNGKERYSGILKQMDDEEILREIDSNLRFMQVILEESLDTWLIRQGDWDGYAKESMENALQILRASKKVA